MKLLPVTLTLFDKATNNTYKGTLLLKNLNGLENDLNATTAEPGSDYDGKGAGLFIILVVSVYALSIVLFIASFITKKAATGETSDDNMVNTYLHKVGDLKEKTARDTFKKLKMSIISKVEMDSENQKRNRKNSKGAKDMQSMSRTGSKTSLSDPSKVIAHRASTEAIHSTGLLPKEDDATLPLLAGASDPSTPHPQDMLFPNPDGRGLLQGGVSPSLRRATSARMLTVIREVQESGGEGSPQVGRTVSYHDVSSSGHNQGARRMFPHSKSLDSDVTLVKKVIDSQPVDNNEEPPTEPIAPPAEFGSRASLFKPVKKQPPDDVTIDVPPGVDVSDAASSAYPGPSQPMPTESKPGDHHSMERPRPRYTPSRHVDNTEEVWQQQRPQQPILPPPAPQKTSRKPVNLRVRIPPHGEGSDIWVLRNGRGEPRTEAYVPEGRPYVPEGRPYSPHTEGHTSASRRTRSPGRPHEHSVSEALRAQRESDRGRTKRDKSPRDKSPRNKSPRDKSPRDKPPRDWSPRDWSRDRSPRRVLDPEDSFYPHDSRSLPLPFRSPSPRSPPRSPNSDRMPPATRVSPSSFRLSPDVTGASNWRDKATLKVTLDRSPEPEDDPYGCVANRAYEQSPRLAGMRHAELLSERANTPPRVSFTDSRLQVPNPRFPVTFNSPGLPRKSPEKGGVQISKV